MEASRRTDGPPGSPVAALGEEDPRHVQLSLGGGLLRADLCPPRKRLVYIDLTLEPVNVA